jgi:hypothetical protein
MDETIPGPVNKGILKSPVLALIILVALVVLSSALSHPHDFLPDSKNTPKFGMECHRTVEGDYILIVQEFTSRSEDYVGVGQAEYYHKVNDFATVDFGKVSDIYGLDNTFEPWPWQNSSFYDMDRDGRISPGDHFLLISEENGGLASPGHNFYLKFSETDETMNMIILQNGTIEPLHSKSHTAWLETVMDGANISFDELQTATSRYQALRNQYFKLSFSFDYMGEKERNLTLYATGEGIEGFEVLYTLPGTGGKGNPKANHVQWSDRVRPDIVVPVDEWKRHVPWNVLLFVNDSDTGKVLFRASTSINIISRSSTKPSFSTDLFAVPLAMGIVFLAAVARKTKLTNK